MDALDPIRLGFDLTCTADHAFAVYTGRIGEWWPPRYTRDAATLQSVTIEPLPGGSIFATHDDGLHVWGEVLVWVPGRRLTHSFTLAQDPDLPTEVSVEFVDTSPGCRMDFTHGGWIEGMEVARGRFEDWPVLLHRMVLLTGE